MILFCAKYDYVKSAGYAYQPNSKKIISLFNNNFADNLPIINTSSDNTTVTITFGQSYFSLYVISAE